jgi:transposase
MGQISQAKPKKKALKATGIIVYVDEATFRQTPTVVRTWAPISSQPQIPTEGQRNKRKVFGAVASDGRIEFRIGDENFGVETYLSFLEGKVMRGFYRRNHPVFLVQDNAAYHKAEATYEWFKDNRKYIEVTNLPPYFPEMNAAEKLWLYTRKNGTHNRYFKEVDELERSLRLTLGRVRNNPENIKSLVRPFF